MVYYSFSTNNLALARHLKERLQCDELAIEEEKKRSGFSIFLDLIFKRRPKLKRYTTDVSAYDNFILIAPIWAGKIAMPMLSFLQQERKNIRRYAFITLCGGVAGQKEKIEDFLASTMETRPVVVEELWVNDLLTPEKRDKVKYTTPYRVQAEDWQIFGPKIDRFIKAAIPSVAKKVEITP